MANQWSDIPDGVYRARATEAALSATSKDKPMVVVTFDLKAEGWEGIRCQWRGYFTEKTTERTLDSLRHCGWTGDDVSNLEGITSNDVDLDIRREKDLKGNWSPKVQWVNKQGSARPGAPMAADKASAFAAAMRRAAEASRAKAGIGGAPQGNVPSFS